MGAFDSFSCYSSSSDEKQRLKTPRLVPSQLRVTRNRVGIYIKFHIIIIYLRITNVEFSSISIAIAQVMVYQVTLCINIFITIINSWAVVLLFIEG